MSFDEELEVILPGNVLPIVVLRDFDHETTENVTCYVGKEKAGTGRHGSLTVVEIVNAEGFECGVTTAASAEEVRWTSVEVPVLLLNHNRLDQPVLRDAIRKFLNAGVCTATTFTEVD